MKKDGLWRWYLRSFRPWIPALILLVLCHVAIACLGVGFALGSQEVIDTAVNGAKTGEHQPFVYACVKQAALILSIIVINAASHLIHEQLMAVMDRDWKHNLLHRLLRGEFAAVSKYHTGELLNLMNNDVRIMITSVLNLLPSIATMTTKLIAALSVLIAMEPKLTYVVVAAGVTVVIVTGFIRRKLKSLNKQVSKAQGKLTYKKSGGNKKITVSAEGKLTVKKGLKKGTYKVKVKVTAAGNKNYKAGSKTATVTVKVK